MTARPSPGSGHRLDRQAVSRGLSGTIDGHGADCQSVRRASLVLPTPTENRTDCSPAFSVTQSTRKRSGNVSVQCLVGRAPVKGDGDVRGG